MEGQMWFVVLMAGVAIPVLIGAALFGVSIAIERTEKSELPHGGM
jgi:hypothetical protein